MTPSIDTLALDIGFLISRSQFLNHGLDVHAQSAYSSTVTLRRPSTASASGLTPFSIIDTHSDIVWRSKWVFCGWSLL